MKTVRTVLWTPSELFRGIESHPTWKLAFFAVVAGNVLLTWLKSCLRGSSFVVDLSLIVGSFISLSIVLLALWSMLSLFLYLFLILFNAQEKLKYRIVFSLVTHCGAIFLIGEWMNFILLRLGIVKTTSLMLPNRFPVGLDLLLIGKSSTLPLVVLLHSINPFTIWYFASIALGLSILGGLDKKGAWLAALSAWAIGVSFVLLLISAIGGTSIGIKVG